MTKINIKIPTKKSPAYIKQFFENLNLGKILQTDSIKKIDINKKKINNPYGPNLNDLYYLYKIITENKRTTILEFGSGWSSLVMANALTNLKKKYQVQIKKIRRNNPFELFILENEKKYLNLTKKKLKGIKQIKVNYFFSDVYMHEVHGCFATKYSNLPLCNPDFIYLDGPDLFNVKKSKNNFTTAHPDLMPMVSDILSIEFFLTPGTIILADGRGANVEFLKKNFKRRWKYKYLKNSDQHIFLLNDTPIGELNKKQIKFYNKK